ncbi:MAG: HAMP domain-containing sensor histidine kinase [Deltaproteobacteria bacterium]
MPQLNDLDHSAVIDHLPEFLDGLGHWIDGDRESARTGFDALATGHALQRLGYGVALETLTREYAIERSVLVAEARDHATLDELIALNEGMDEAILAAVRRYTEERDRARDRFVGILGHDLRTPLNAIAIAASVLLTGTDEAQQKLGNTIRRSTDRMARMVRDVIDFALGNLGEGFPIALVKTDLGDVCEDAVAELRIAHPDRKIVIEIEGDLLGHFDADRVLQAISNLVGNAIQHGADPIVVIAREAEDHHSITTLVRNGGRAIPDRERAGLFDPYRRGSGPAAGLGLGLYIVQQIAVAHGALCKVTSDDEATTVAIVWPRVPLEETPRR